MAEGRRGGCGRRWWLEEGDGVDGNCIVDADGANKEGDEDASEGRLRACREVLGACETYAGGSVGVRLTMMVGGSGSGMFASTRRRGRSGCTTSSLVVGGVVRVGDAGSGTGASFAMKYSATRRFSDTALSDTELVEDRSVSGATASDVVGAGPWEDTGRGRGPRVLGSRRERPCRAGSYAGGASSTPSIVDDACTQAGRRESARLSHTYASCAFPIFPRWSRCQQGMGALPSQHFLWFYQTRALHDDGGRQPCHATRPAHISKPNKKCGQIRDFPSFLALTLFASFPAIGPLQKVVGIA